MNTTLKDVALEAKVSMQTVSRVVNNDPMVSKDTEVRVKKIIERLDYKPNFIARGLRRKKTNTIGFIIPDIVNPSFPELVKGAVDFFYSNGFYVFLFSSDNDINKEIEFIRDLNSMWISGMIIVPSYTESRDISIFNKIKSPFIIVDREIKGLNKDVVVINNLKESYKAVKYLIGCGHRTIVILAGLENTTTAQKRYKGWEKAMKEKNLFKEELILWGHFSISSGYKMMKQVFNKFDKIDAVFACNDLIALGAIEAIEEKKFKIPEDISIIGFDDIYVSRFLKPPLTTIQVPLFKMGEKAAEVLLGRIKNDENFIPKRIVIECNLIKRGSVARKIYK